MRPVAIFRFSPGDEPGRLAHWLDVHGVPWRLIALHEGEAVIPKRFNPAAGGSPASGARVTFNPTTIIQVDARSDQAQVQLIAAKAAADANQRQLEQLHALGVL